MGLPGIKKYFVLFGVFLTNIPNGVSWYIGDLSTYTVSYLRQNLGSHTNVHTPWIMSTGIVCWTMGLYIGGLIQPRLGIRWTTLLGILGFDTAILMTHFTVKHSMLTYVLTMGVAVGVFDGIIYSVSLSFIVMWEPKRVGVATGVSCSSLGIGGVVMIQTITRYINPKDLPPDFKDGNFVLFKQDEILNKVPSVFFVLAAMSFGFHLLGFTLLRYKPPETQFEILSKTQPVKDVENIQPMGNVGNVQVDDTGDCVYDKHVSHLSDITRTFQCSQNCLESGKTITSPQSTAEGARNLLKKDKISYGSITKASAQDLVENGLESHSQETEDRKAFDENIIKTVATSGEFCQNFSDREVKKSDSPTAENACPDCICGKNTSKLEHGEVKESLSCDKKAANSSIGPNFTPRQMLRTRAFYVLLVTQIAIDYGMTMLGNYYKLFGAVWIADDHFLATLGAVMTALTVFPRLFWGAMLDRCGMQTALVTLTSGTVFMSGFWFMAPRVDKWFYFVWTIAFSWFVCAYDSLVSAAVVKTFGVAHLEINYGIVATSSAVLQVASPLFMDMLLKQVNWAGLFLSVSVLNCVALLMIVIFLHRFE